MGVNYCRVCGSSPRRPGRGWLHDPMYHWLKFWKIIICPNCGGDGYAKPPGWPDEQAMRALRPTPPPPPPAKY